MNIESINLELKQILEITEKWNIYGVKSIERAIVLAKLESVYELLLFSNNHVEVRNDEPEYEQDKQQTELNAAISADVRDEALGEEVDFELSEEFEPQKEEEVQQPAARQPKFTRDIIRSLYGDDTFTVVNEREQVNEMEAAGEQLESQAETIEQVLEQQPQIVEETIKTIEEPIVEPEEEVAVHVAPTETHIQETELDFATVTEPKPVLADVYAMQEHKTIADTIGQSIHTTDMATKIVSSATQDLRKSIGINDKFLLIRDVFNNNAEEYNNAMEQFEQCADLNDALLYIHENIHANPNSDGMKLLVELLSRKLS